MFVRSLSTLFAFLALSCSSFAQATATIPHFACGGGWSTTVMLTHGLWYPYSTSANPWKLHFAIDVRSKDNKQIFSSLETLPNQNGTYTRRFACDSDEIETGRIDFIFFDSEIGNFGQPQRRIWPIAMFSYTKDGQTLEAGLQAQFMSGVDTIVGVDAQGQQIWKRIAPMAAYVPIVQTDGYKHGIAVSNQHDRSVRVGVVFRDQAGLAVHQRYFTLRPRETTSWTVDEVADGFIGSAQIYNAEDIGIYQPIGLAAFRFSPSGQFASVFNGY